MKFYIHDTFTGGSGQEFKDKEAFLRELSLMIDDCIANGGTFFDATVDTNASCFYTEETKIDGQYHDASEDLNEEDN